MQIISHENQNGPAMLNDYFARSEENKTKIKNNNSILLRQNDSLYMFKKRRTVKVQKHISTGLSMHLFRYKR